MLRRHRPLPWLAQRPLQPPGVCQLHPKAVEQSRGLACKNGLWRRLCSGRGAGRQWQRLPGRSLPRHSWSPKHFCEPCKQQGCRALDTRRGTEETRDASSNAELDIRKPGRQNTSNQSRFYSFRAWPQTPPLGLGATSMADSHRLLLLCGCDCRCTNDLMSMVTTPYSQRRALVLISSQTMILSSNACAVQLTRAHTTPIQS